TPRSPQSRPRSPRAPRRPSPSKDSPQHPSKPVPDNRGGGLRRRKGRDMADAWLIVGLGNPIRRYELTRHNVGQLVLDELAARRGESFRAHKANARVAETWLRPGGAKLILAKPNTFMNVSGGPVAGLAKFYGVEPAHVVVV